MGSNIMGPEVKELEAQLAAFVGVGQAISCSSGTDALLMALMALEIGAGDEVITVPYTWISSAEGIALLGAKTVFVDVQPDTFNMDPDLLEAAITPRTRAMQHFIHFLYHRSRKSQDEFSPLPGGQNASRRSGTVPPADQGGNQYVHVQHGCWP
jgi:hypothetical protein